MGIGFDSMTDNALLMEHRFQRRQRALLYYYHSMSGKWPDKLCDADSPDPVLPWSEDIKQMADEIFSRGLTPLMFTQSPDDLF